MTITVLQRDSPNAMAQSLRGGLQRNPPDPPGGGAGHLVALQGGGKTITTLQKDFQSGAAHNGACFRCASRNNWSVRSGHASQAGESSCTGGNHNAAVDSDFSHRLQPDCPGDRCIPDDLPGKTRSVCSCFLWQCLDRSLVIFKQVEEDGFLYFVTSFEAVHCVKQIRTRIAQEKQMRLWNERMLPLHRCLPWGTVAILSFEQCLGLASYKSAMIDAADTRAQLYLDEVGRNHGLQSNLFGDRYDANVLFGHIDRQRPVRSISMFKREKEDPSHVVVLPSAIQLVCSCPVFRTKAVHRERPLSPHCLPLLEIGSLDYQVKFPRCSSAPSVLLARLI